MLWQMPCPEDFNLYGDNFLLSLIFVLGCFHFVIGPRNMYLILFDFFCNRLHFSVVVTLL